MKSIDNDIKSGQLKQVYLLYGEETYLIRQYRDKLKKVMVSDEPTFLCSSPWWIPPVFSMMSGAAPIPTWPTSPGSIPTMMNASMTWTAPGSCTKAAPSPSGGGWAARKRNKLFSTFFAGRASAARPAFFFCRS